MLHIHHVNLQPLAGGGEVYTLSLSKAFAEAGARVTLYAHPAVHLWDALGGNGVELVRIRSEAQLLERLPGERTVVLTQGPVSVPVLEKIAARHALAGFAHMPMLGRSAEPFRPYHLVATVSRYCLDLLRKAGVQRLHPEPVYGIADLARGDDAPLRARSPYLWDRRKLRDRLLGALQPLAEPLRRRPAFERAPGLALGIVSLIAPIKQLPLLFSLLAPILAARDAVRLEVFGSGGYAQVRELKRALAPLGARARFWGYQPNVAAVYPRLDYLMTGLPEKEALGLNAIEAQACGTPVLAPDAPPFTETVLEGASGFRYRDPREDGGARFAETLDALLAGRPRPDPRAAAAAHLAQFRFPALLERARALLAALGHLQ